MNRNPIYSVIEELNAKPYTPEDNAELVALLTENADLFKGSAYDYNVSMYMTVSVSRCIGRNFYDFFERKESARGWFVLTRGAKGFNIRYGDRYNDDPKLKSCGSKDGRELITFAMDYIDSIKVEDSE